MKHSNIGRYVARYGWVRSMRMALAVLCSFGMFVMVVASAYAADLVLPDPKLTPGAVMTTDTSTICQPGYSRSVRHTSGQLKHQVYVEYGIDRDADHYEIDHLIPLGVGGADTRENLWPQSRDTQSWNAGAKDRLENYMHKEICAGRMPVEEAQRDIATDWIAAYRKYLGTP